MARTVRSTWARVIVVALAGLFVAQALSPAVAAFTPSKKSIKKIAGKVAAKMIKQASPRVGASIVPDGPVDPTVAAADGMFTSTSVTAPAPGYLMLSASAGLFNATTDNTMLCFLRLGTTDLASSNRRISHNGAQNVNEQEDCATETVVPVNAGTYTVEFRYAGASPGNTAYSAVVLSALWVPYNGQGAKPTTFPAV